METSVIVVAWLGGVAVGSTVAIGAIALITGRMPLNPARIDWSVAEARALGAITTTLGVYLAVFTFFSAVQIASHGSPPVWALPLMVLIPLGGSIATGVVGRRHDARNPAKRYWRW
jgi:hypothetical protein